MSTETVIALIIILIIFIAAMLYWLYSDKPVPTPPPGGGGSSIPDTPVPTPTGSITDCNKFGTLSTASPVCREGTQIWNGTCYTDVWSQAGGTKTALCTVSYGPYNGVYTKCGIGIYDLNYGDPCPMVGPGYYKTAVCTCQLQGDITAGQYCQSQGPPTQCPSGTDGIQGLCYTAPCPAGYKRTGRCTCSPHA